MAKKKLEKQLAKFKEIQEYFDKIPNMIDVAVKAGLAYYGMKAFNHPAGALVALVGFELAKSQNIVAGGSGVATLASIGLAGIKRGDPGFKEVPWRHGR